MSTALGLELLLAAGFWIHYAMVLIVIGIPCLVLLAALFGPRPILAKASEFYGTKYPVVYSFTITAGVVPLLFLQVLSHRAFYQSMVNLRWFALSTLLVMVVVFYAAYVGRSWPHRRTLCAAFSIVGLAYIAAFFATLHRSVLAPAATLTAAYWSGQIVVPYFTLFHHFGSAIVSSLLAMRSLLAHRPGMALGWPLIFAAIFTTTRETARWRSLPKDLVFFAQFDGSTLVFATTLVLGIACFVWALRTR